MPLRVLLCAVFVLLAVACGDGDGKQAKATATASATPAACTYKPDDLWVEAHKEPAADVPRSLAAFVAVWEGKGARRDRLGLSITNVERDAQSRGGVPFRTSGWTNAFVDGTSLSRSGSATFLDERTLTFAASRDSSNLDFGMTFVISDDLQTLTGTVENKGEATTFTLSRCEAGK